MMDAVTTGPAFVRNAVSWRPRARGGDRMGNRRPVEATATAFTCLVFLMA